MERLRDEEQNLNASLAEAKMYSSPPSPPLLTPPHPSPPPHDYTDQIREVKKAEELKEKALKERNTYIQQKEWAKTELETTRKQVEWVNNSVKDLEMVTPENHLNLHSLHSSFIVVSVCYY
jgi:hypothetical protein